MKRVSLFFKAFVNSLKDKPYCFGGTRESGRKSSSGISWFFEGETVRSSPSRSFLSSTRCFDPSLSVFRCFNGLSTSFLGCKAASSLTQKNSHQKAAVLLQDGFTAEDHLLYGYEEKKPLCLIIGKKRQKLQKLSVV